MFDTTCTESLALALADHDERIGAALDAAADVKRDADENGITIDTIGAIPMSTLMDAATSVVPAVEYFLAISTRFEV